MIALAAGGLFSAACKDSAPAPAEKTSKVECMGINECKGHGACKTASNACAGQNGCGGQGMTHTASEKECTDRGGSVMARK